MSQQKPLFILQRSPNVVETRMSDRGDYFYEVEFTLRFSGYDTDNIDQQIARFAFDLAREIRDCKLDWDKIT